MVRVGRHAIKFEQCAVQRRRHVQRFHPGLAFGMCRMSSACAGRSCCRDCRGSLAGMELLQNECKDPGVFARCTTRASGAVVAILPGREAMTT